MSALARTERIPLLRAASKAIQLQWRVTAELQVEEEKLCAAHVVQALEAYLQRQQDVARGAVH
jgi:hypothetical protein